MNNSKEYISINYINTSHVQYTLYTQTPGEPIQHAHTSKDREEGS